MRSADHATPPVNLHTDAQLDRWPMRPVVAISGLRNVAEYDDPDLVYDQNVDPASARVGFARVGSARVGRS